MSVRRAAHSEASRPTLSSQYTPGKNGMWRNTLLFGAALLLALTAGRAFWVTLGESPFNMSAATYVEFFQQLDRRIAVPIAVTGVGGTLLAGFAAIAHRADRRAFYLLLA